MKIIITDSSDKSEVEFIRSKIHEYNSSVTNIPPITPLNVYAHNETKEIIGGLSGLTWGNWLQIQLLWVNENFRKEGIGTKLLLQAENEACKRDCSFALVDTFSFQAKPFYLRHGYQVQMTIEDCPYTEQRFYMTKDLRANNSLES